MLLLSVTPPDVPASVSESWLLEAVKVPLLVNLMFSGVAPLIAPLLLSYSFAASSRTPTPVLGVAS